MTIKIAKHIFFFLEKLIFKQLQILSKKFKKHFYFRNNELPCNVKIIT